MCNQYVREPVELSDWLFFHKVGGLNDEEGLDDGDGFEGNCPLSVDVKPN